MNGIWHHYDGLWERNSRGQGLKKCTGKPSTPSGFRLSHCVYIFEKILHHHFSNGPSLNLDESRFPSCCKIPFAFKICCVSPNYATYMYFGQIQDPENTPPDLSWNCKKKFCLPFCLLPGGHIVPVTTQIQGNIAHCDCSADRKTGS